jgi:hypothetical protein
MNIAVCFSGHIRTGVKASKNIKHFIGDLFDECDFFIHSWNYDTHKPVFGSTETYEESVSEDKINTFLDIYKPKRYIIGTEKLLPMDSMLFSMGNSFKLAYKYKPYDVIVKLRPDVLFAKSRKLIDEIENYKKDTSILYTDNSHPSKLDDVFWLLNETNAKILGEWFINTRNHTPDLLIEFLQKNNIKFDNTYRKHLHYCIYRRQSEIYDPLDEFRECFIHDAKVHSPQEWINTILSWDVDLFS